MILEPYQEKFIEQLRIAYKEGFKAPLLVARTGAGKTVTFSYIAKNAKGITYIIVHRRELIKQASKTLTALGVPHGVIASNVPMFMHHRVQVASIQTIINKIDIIKAPDLIVIDEAHHCVMKSMWGRFINHYPKAKILGVTATPQRMDGRGLGEIFDYMVLGPTFEELVEVKRLVKFEYYLPPSDIDFESIPKEMGDVSKKEQASRMSRSTIVGDAVKHYNKYAKGLATIVFCVSVAEAERTAQTFRDAGVDARCIHGGLHDTVRDEYIDGLTSGRYRILTFCDLISEGTDIPRIECVILLRRTKSITLFLQVIGRGLRWLPGKGDLIIIDAVGNYYDHGFPDEEHEWALEYDKKKAKKKPKPVTNCEKCFRQYSSKPRCPRCNTETPSHESAPTQIDGELVKADPETMKHARKEERKQLKTLEDLENYARIKGYKKGWARHIWEARMRRGS